MTAHYVAVLDTGGISYSGRVYVAVAQTEDAAVRAAAGKFLGGRVRRIGTAVLRTPQDVDDYYGIRRYGPIQDGAAVEGD